MAVSILKSPMALARFVSWLVLWSCRGIARFVTELLHAALMTAAAAAVLVIVFVNTTTKDLPSLLPLQAYAPATVNRVYAADGTLISEFAKQRRIYVAIDHIPDVVQQAFIAAEDQRFFSHHGIDLRGIGRAMRANIRSLRTGAALQGASTITQQVAKNLLLTPEKSIRRKVREAFLAMRIEQVFSKRRILEVYLNALYLGQRSYGVAAAAQAYFGKGLRDLTIAEAATLAGLAKSPSRNNPLRRPKAARERRDYVLRRMVEDGHISRFAYAQALKQPLTLSPHRNPVRRAGHGYVVDQVRRSVTQAYGQKRIARGGLTIRTSINDRLQAIGRQTLREALVAYDRRHGWRGPLMNLADAGISIDGQANTDLWRSALAQFAAPAGIGAWRIALVLEVRSSGARIGFVDGAKGTISLRQLGWARAQVTKKLRSGRQYKTASKKRVRHPAEVLVPGDIVLVSRLSPNKATKKGRGLSTDFYRLEQLPEVAGALVAMEAGSGRVLAMIGGYSFARSEFNNATQAWRQPGSAFKPILFATALENGFTPSTLINDAPFRLRYKDVLYRPKNYSGRYYGPTTLRVALERSRNVASLRLAMRVGIDKVAAMAKRLHLAPRIPQMPSMVLGSRETTAMRLAAAYSVFVNGGRLVRPTVIDRVQTRTGRTIFRQAQRTCSYCRNVRWEGQSRPDFRDSRRRVVSSASAFQITHMMRGVVERGTGKRVRGLAQPLGGKTGTTNDSMDAWFVGFTPDMVVAVWVGFPRTYSLGPKEEGGRTAAPIFRTFMARALKGQPVRAFVPPKGLVKLVVNPVTGLPSQAARVIDDYFKPGRIPSVDGAYVPDGGLMHRPSYLSANPDGVSDSVAGSSIDGEASDDAASQDDAVGEDEGDKRPKVKPGQLSGTEY